MWCSVVWCSVVWFGVVWCGLVWFGVVCSWMYAQSSRIPITVRCFDAIGIFCSPVGKDSTVVSELTRPEMLSDCALAVDIAHVVEWRAPVVHAQVYECGGNAENQWLEHHAPPLYGLISI